MTRILLAAATALALAGCASGASTVATDTTAAAGTLTTAEADANAALTVAEATLTAYEATKNPSPAVIAEAKKLDAGRVPLSTNTAPRRPRHWPPARRWCNTC
jgi:ABC-type enterochelin transport system substrate-binding protein